MCFFNMSFLPYDTYQAAVCLEANIWILPASKLRIPYKYNRVTGVYNF